MAERQRIPRYVSADDLADILGVHVETIRNWSTQRKIPCTKLSHRLVRYDLDEVLDHLNRNCKKEAVGAPKLRRRQNKKKQAIVDFFA